MLTKACTYGSLVACFIEVPGKVTNSWFCLLASKEVNKNRKVCSKTRNKLTIIFIVFRTFWGCSLLISAAILFPLIYFCGQKFLSRDVIVKQIYFKASIGDAPFPAVTICPDSLVFEKIFEFENKSLSGKFSDDE